MSVSQALAIATTAHQGVFDKQGVPYIQHPIRVAGYLMTIDPYFVTDKHLEAALLHDVVEDTRWTLTDLLDHGFSTETVEAVAALTRRDGETYEDFIDRCKLNPIARLVKLADIRDNTDPNRVIPGEDPAKHASRLRKYEKARKTILDHIKEQVNNDS